MKESHLRIFSWGLMSSNNPQTSTVRSCLCFVVLAPGPGECVWEWKTWEAQRGTCGCEHPAHIHPATRRHVGREGSL